MTQKDIRQFFGPPPVGKTREDVSTNDTTEASVLCRCMFVWVINCVCKFVCNTGVSYMSWCESNSYMGPNLRIQRSQGWESEVSIPPILYTGMTYASDKTWWRKNDGSLFEIGNQHMLEGLVSTKAFFLTNLVECAWTSTSKVIWDTTKKTR